MPSYLIVLVCVLTYFFKSYHHFFNSAFLLVCDITTFSKRYHDFFKWDFTTFSDCILKPNLQNKIEILALKLIKQGLNQGIISRIFQLDFA